MSLFQAGEFHLHSGGVSNWKIECESLTEDDWDALALMLAERLPPFGRAVGVPRGGLPLQASLFFYETSGPVLLVDDVLTTGASMEKMRKLYTEPTIGAVVFARGPIIPEWITPLFRLHPPRPPG